jgi:hypothetical protein
MMNERIPLLAVAPHDLADVAGPHAAADLAVVAPEGLAVAEGLPVERIAPRPGGHRTGCACCAPRAALAAALNRLFIRRARGEVGFFRRVAVAMPRADIEGAFRDVLVSARFRIESPEPPRAEHHSGNRSSASGGGRG